MAKATPEQRFQCLELAMRVTTNKVAGALEYAEQFVRFIEKDETKVSSGQPAKSGPRKTTGKTVDKGAKALE